MSKAIMISIKPEWVAKILNGEKTIEIRKTMPRCELPIDVYIYCTKSNDFHLDWGYDKKHKREYFCWDKKVHHYPFEKDDIEYQSQKVLAKFTLNKVEEYELNSEYAFNLKPLFDWSCLNLQELRDYSKMKNVYAWQIDNLQIFDEPKELRNFKKVGFSSELNDFIDRYKWNVKNMPLDMAEDEQNSYEENYNIIKENYEISKAPKSWCYVEVEND